MLTKMLAAIVMTGALWVAGDAAYQKFGCCFEGSDCCNPARECCVLAAKQPASDCCSTGSSCCSAVKSNSNVETTRCCDSAYTYCMQTGEIYDGCCCEIVDGQFRCLITGVVSDECCCIPIE